MRHELLFAALALGGVPGSACAMTTPDASNVACTVEGAQLLAADAGGAAAVCEAIVRTIPAGSGAASVDVRIMSPHMMVATTVMGDGTRLPDVKTARSDGSLGRSSFQRLADALAAQLSTRTNNR